MASRTHCFFLFCRIKLILACRGKPELHWCSTLNQHLANLLLELQRIICDPVAHACIFTVILNTEMEWHARSITSWDTIYASSILINEQDSSREREI
uniref:Putative secreted protein n=1 Tax=Ixodes scapularis TaxID=6945 RepID=A0A4D5RDX1_IXOSC